jgi:hypothetical protein
MFGLSRRKFLKQAVLGVGAASLASSATGRAAAFSLQNPADIASDFIQGTVIAVSSTEFTSQDDRRQYAVRVTTDTRLWRGRITSLAEVEIGDFVYGIGTPLEDGTIVAMKLWFNIVNFYGEVESIVGPNNLCIAPASGKQAGFKMPLLTVAIDSDTILNAEDSISSLTLKVGDPIQIIGLALRNGDVKATRIWTLG